MRVCVRACVHACVGTLKLSCAHTCVFVSVNGVAANKDTVIKNNDLITHRVHRHEPPVVDDHIDIVHKDDELVVINKPASIPVRNYCFMYGNAHMFNILLEQNFGTFGGFVTFKHTLSLQSFVTMDAGMYNQPNSLVLPGGTNTIFSQKYCT